jgi:CDP-diglyceride synthetase
LFLNTREVIKYREENKLTKFKSSLKIALKSFLTFLSPTTFLLGLMLLNRIDSLNISGINSFSGYFGWVALTITFLIPILADSSAMLCGMAIKGPKLCPKISPKKTISGAVCGVVIPSLILGALFYVFNAFSVI